MCTIPHRKEPHSLREQSYLSFHLSFIPTRYYTKGNHMSLENIQTPTSVSEDSAPTTPSTSSPASRSSSSPDSLLEGPVDAPRAPSPPRVAQKRAQATPPLLPTPADYAAYLQDIVGSASTPVYYMRTHFHARSGVCASDVTHFSQYHSIPPIEEAASLPAEMHHFQALIKDIMLAHGDVRDFALNTKAEYFDWLRVSATRLVRRLLHPNTHLPFFEAKNLSAFAYTLEGVSPKEFPYDLLSVDTLYRMFFLDYALPLCVYLYSQDLHAKREAFTPLDRRFLAEFDYYAFVATITYLGSLLLIAAEGYSRVLYEGVRWMLLRAYCILGILDWKTESVYDKALISDSDELFKDIFHPNMRFSAEETLGDSYAQHGWELFKRRPYALNYLASITQIAFFNDNRRNSSDYPTAYNDKGLASYCRSIGYIVYDPSLLLRPISTQCYRKKDLKIFCTTELQENRVFYSAPIAKDNGADTIHEWYFIFDVLGIFECDRKTTSPYLLQKQKQQNIPNFVPKYFIILKPENPEDLAAYTALLDKESLSDAEKEKRIEAKIKEKEKREKERIEATKVLSLDFPIPPMFGLHFNPKTKEYQFDLATYFTVRYKMTFNPLILNTIPNALYTFLRKTDEERCAYILNLCASIDNLSVACGYDASYSIESNLGDGVSRDAVFQLCEDKAELVRLIKIQVSDIVRDLLGINKLFIELSSDFCLPEDTLRSYAETVRSAPKLSQVKSPTKFIDMSHARIVPLPPKTSNPDVIFFALRLVNSEYCTMLVTKFKDSLYMCFSGPLQSKLEQCISIDTAVAKNTKMYKVYPYTFVPSFVVTYNSFMSALNPLTSILNIQTIVRMLTNRYSVANNFAIACALKETPDDIRQHKGFTNPKEYLDYCSTIPMDPVVMHHIASIYSLPLPKSTYDAAVALGVPETAESYNPHFTEEEDRHIFKLYSPRMTPKDKESLIHFCLNRPWSAIETRARKLAKKMLEEERVFNINILPVRNYTAKTKELLERNFNAALNIDPRLKVNDTNKTEAALRKKYLTPRPRRPL